MIEVCFTDRMDEVLRGCWSTKPGLEQLAAVTEGDADKGADTSNE